MRPHIKNSNAGVNREDPVYQNIFEVYFTLPAALQGVGSFSTDINYLSQQVLKVSGLGTLDKGVAAGQQKFMGTDRSYLQAKPDGTHHELEIEVTLNMRNRTDNYIYKLLKAWNKLGYDLSTGETTLKQDYVADWFKVVIGNRAGDIYREIIFKDVMLVDGLKGFEELNYETQDHVNMTFTLVSDWADDTDA